MSDLVARLREQRENGEPIPLMQEAADALEVAEAKAEMATTFWQRSEAWREQAEQAEAAEARAEEHAKVCPLEAQAAFKAAFKTEDRPLGEWPTDPDLAHRVGLYVERHNSALTQAKCSCGWKSEWVSSNERERLVEAHWSENRTSAQPEDK